MIAIIDYGVGNIKAFANIYKQLNVPIKNVRCIDDLEDVSKLILPGVGSFDYAMEQLENSGMREKLDELVLKNKVPLLGVCVGMQMLADSSDEGELRGLSWINGSVKKINTVNVECNTRLPHMGWNDVVVNNERELFKGLETDSRFYFLHSYYFEAAHQSNVIASTDYGDKFTCAVKRENIFGVQFHPEKSHEYGIKLLKNFAEL